MTKFRIVIDPLGETLTFILKSKSGWTYEEVCKKAATWADRQEYYVVELRH